MHARTSAITRGLAAVTAGALTLTACSGGTVEELVHTAGVAARSHLDNPATLGGSRWLPGGLEPAAEDATRSTTVTTRLFDRLGDAETRQEAIENAKTACDVDALIIAGRSPDDAIRYVRDQLHNPYVYRARVQDLVDELGRADSSLDRALILGKAAFCEAMEAAE